MINSIVNLPEFSQPGTIIDGTKYGGIYPSSMVKDVSNIQIGGRQFPIVGGLCKYKLRVTDMYGKMGDIVFVTLEPLDLYNFLNNQSIEIFPIYLRENPCAGYSSHFLSSIILNVAAINRLFTKLGVPNVCNVAYAIQYAVSRLTNDIHHIPEWILDNKCDPRYATLACIDDTLIEDLTYGGNDAANRLQDLAGRACVPAGMVSGEWDAILSSNYFLQIMGIFDPGHYNSLIEMSVRSAAEQYSSYFSIIHNCEPPYGDKYLSGQSANSMDRLLYYSTLFKTQDFDVVLPGAGYATPPVCKGLDVNVDINTFLVDNFNILAGFNRAIRSEVRPDIIPDEQLKVTGSYLEDMWVYDSENNLIRYIDLVWWILAAGAGLINISSVCID